MITKRTRTADDFGQEFKDMLQANGLETENIEAVVMASVVPDIMPVLRGGIRKYLKREPFIIKADSNTGIVVKTERPAELGVDRLINAAAAYHFYGGAVLVIDFGTATTFDVVTASGEFLGGAISPGIQISSDALSEKASMLPTIEVRKPDSILGTNTVSSMQAGVFFGYIGQVEYISTKYRKMLDEDMKVIATGGLSGLFMNSTNAINVYDMDLTCKGIKYIYERENAENTKYNTY